LGIGLKVQASTQQRRRLEELRRRHGLSSGSEHRAGLNTWELHDLAVEASASASEEELRAIVEHPACDLGTALLVYWTAAPHYYLQYASREEVEAFEVPGWDLLATIEARVAGGHYTSQQVRFDPRNDKQTRSIRGKDWTVDDRLVRTPPKRAIPPIMLQAVG